MEIITCDGFKAAGIAAGIKKNGEMDLGLIYSEVPATVAGVFTRNRVQAAPVVLDRERIRSGHSQAIIVNSGNANCCMGERGLTDAKAMAKHAAEALGISESLVLVSSTGVIGQRLPVEHIKKAVPGLVKSLSETGFQDFAASIMTTDTCPKIILRNGEIGDKPFKIIGIAKGSGMICPNMATMLCFVCTDAAVDREILQKVLLSATHRSFNRITIDGDTSTNDMILIMSNGLAEAKVQNTDQIESFQRVLDEVLVQLARQLVIDGEGATKTSSNTR